MSARQLPQARLWASPVLALLCAVNTALGAEPPKHPAPARTKGWAFKTPPDQIKPESGRRNHIFFVGESVVFKLGGAATTYEVRDYFGELVDQGAAGASATLKVTLPGWYKLYVYGKETRPEWGDIVGATTFVIFRKNPNFPAPPDPKQPGPSYYPSMDQVSRAVIGMGPQRHFVQDAGKPAEEIKRIEATIAYDRQEYLLRDPVRQRALMVAFPNGTKDLHGVKQIVARYQADVKYWEPRNEPNFGAGGADFVKNELIGFHDTVKAVDPALKVMGPGTVNIGPQCQGWLHDFFRAGGGKYIDVFSFHIYNGINGDLQLGRWSMDGLQAILARYGLEKIEKWQTEQGYFAAVYGAYQPRLQGRWTMLEMMLFEQYGIPKEHNHLWYDISHGFWDFPTWWENDDGGYNPAAPLMRVMSEELYGTTFARAFDFGKDGNKLYLGSLFAGKDRTVAAFMNAGCGTPTIDLKVAGGDKLRTVSAFGVESDVPVANGVARLTVPELPVYVELAKGQTVDVVRIDWGPNLALADGVTASSSGASVFTGGQDRRHGLGKVFNGFYENWYWRQTPDAQPWMDDSKEFPAWVEVRLPAPATVTRVVIFACVPWQSQGTLVDHELQYEKDGQWVTLGRVTEPLKTFGVYSPPTRTSVDSFFADRSIFEHSFAPATTRKLRVLVHNTTFGGGATALVPEAGGQTGPQRVTLREIEVYGPAPAATLQLRVPAGYVAEAFAKTTVTAVVINKGDATQQVAVRPVAPAGWQVAPPAIPVALAAREAKMVTFDLVALAGALPAGEVSVEAALADGSGRVIDRHATVLHILSPVDLVPQTPAVFDAAKQELTVTVNNATTKAMQATVALALTEQVAAGGRTFNAEQRVDLAPYEAKPVSFTVPDVNLKKSAWHLAYTASANRLTIVATLDLALRVWMAVGPFANDFERAFGPEGGIDLAKTYTTIGGDQPAKWKAVMNESSGFVDLTKAFKPHENCAAYAVIHVKSPTACQALLSAGSDDGIKAWVNRKIVVSNNTTRGAAPGQEKVEVGLAAGWNEVLLKITQGIGGWGFYLEFLTPDGKPMPDLTYAPTRAD